MLLQLLNLFPYNLESFRRGFIVRVQLQCFLVMLRRILQILQRLFIRVPHIRTFFQRSPQVVAALFLQGGGTVDQRLTERLQRLVIFM